MLALWYRTILSNAGSLAYMALIHQMPVESLSYSDNYCIFPNTLWKGSITSNVIHFISTKGQGSSYYLQAGGLGLLWEMPFHSWRSLYSLTHFLPSSLPCWKPSSTWSSVLQLLKTQNYVTPLCKTLLQKLPTKDLQDKSLSGREKKNKTRAHNELQPSKYMIPLVFLKYIFL